jgi:hypothetical protein
LRGGAMHAQLEDCIERQMLQPAHRMELPRRRLPAPAPPLRRDGSRGSGTEPRGAPRRRRAARSRPPRCRCRSRRSCCPCVRQPADRPARPDTG